MKRIKELILRILRYTEEKANGEPLRLPDCRPDYDPQIVRYHVELCEQAGFLKTAAARGTMGRGLKILHLTWQGHEYLDENSD